MSNAAIVSAPSWLGGLRLTSENDQPAFIHIATPRNGGREGRSLDVLGVSDVNEGAMEYTLRGPRGGVVAHGMLQATSGTGTPGFFHMHYQLNNRAAAGAYQLEVFSRSMMDGSIDQRDAVRFRVGSQPLAGPAFIDIATPREQQGVSRRFDVLGVSDVFEGAMQYRVTNARGRAVAQGMIQASSGTGTPGTFRKQVLVPNTAPAGEYKLTVFSPNMKGVGIAQSDSVRLRVR